MKIKGIIKLLFLVSLVSSLCLITPAPAKASFDPSQAAYYEEVNNVFSFTPEQEEMLQNYGFTVVELSALDSNMSAEYAGSDPALRFENFYFYQVYHNDLPVFVTTDSILHLFHVVFDCSLKIIEKEDLYPMALEFTQYAYQTSLNDYNTVQHDGSIEYWATRNSTVYFAVALSLLTGETADVPPELLSDLNFFLDNIYAEDPEFVHAAGWTILDSEPPMGVMISYDFTQFTVRGHYLGDTQLEQYFRTLMWFGRCPVFIPRPNETYTWDAPHIDDACMVYMRDILKSNPQQYENWNQLYDVTNALVGESDSINLLNLEVALNNVFGSANKYLPYLSSPGALGSLREELSKPTYAQQILSQALLSGPEPLPTYPLVYQFMGQRYVPDSYMFQYLCWDKVERNSFGDRRILPSGLDVFAVLGSERAYQLLAPDFDYDGFEENLENLTTTFNNLDESDWQKSSYTSWIYALESLIYPTYSSEYPEFMQTLAWQDEKLNTALGSWAQLRHDTILYAKQTYIPALVCSYPEAFAEPNPTFYSRMQDLCERTLEAVNILEPTDEVHSWMTESLQTLKNATQQLEVISEKELAKEPITEEEIDFMKTLVWNCGSGGFIGWYVDTIHLMANLANSTDILETPVIADVATFPPDDIIYPPQILHVGTGYVNALVVLFPMPNGTLVTAVGPVFSYYEFNLIGTERLNDDEWKEILTWDNRTEYLPEWFQDVYARGEPKPLPEHLNSTIFVGLMVTTLTVLAIRKSIKTKKFTHPKNN
jgi:hypothetical protein